MRRARSIRYAIVDQFPMYRVGTDGTVWSRWRDPNWKQMATHVDKDGYPDVLLQQGKNCGGRKRYVRIHILVLTHFVGPCPEGKESCHRNGNRADSSLSNLRWGTHTSNIKDRARHGTTAKGSGHGKSKLKDQDVHKIIDLLRAGVTYAAIAKLFGVSAGPIYSIAAGRGWKHIQREVIRRELYRWTAKDIEKAVRKRIAANKSRRTSLATG